jgi:hypothetical protein
MLSVHSSHQEVFMMDENINPDVSPFACDLTAIPANERPQHLAAAQRLFQSARSVRELNDGYAFEFDNETELLIQAAEFISRERLCCPFFGFTLEVEAERGAVWMHLTGRRGAKDFIRTEIAEFLGNESAFPRLLSNATT